MAWLECFRQEAASFKFFFLNHVGIELLSEVAEELEPGTTIIIQNHLSKSEASCCLASLPFILFIIHFPFNKKFWKSLRDAS